MIAELKTRIIMYCGLAMMCFCISLYAGLMKLRADKLEAENASLTAAMAQREESLQRAAAELKQLTEKTGKLRQRARQEEDRIGHALKNDTCADAHVSDDVLSILRSPVSVR